MLDALCFYETELTMCLMLQSKVEVKIRFINKIDTFNDCKKKNQLHHTSIYCEVDTAQKSNMLRLKKAIWHDPKSKII